MTKALQFMVVIAVLTVASAAQAGEWRQTGRLAGNAIALQPSASRFLGEHGIRADARIDLAKNRGQRRASGMDGAAKIALTGVLITPPVVPDRLSGAAVPSELTLVPRCLNSFCMASGAGFEPRRGSLSLEALKKA